MPESEKGKNLGIDLTQTKKQSRFPFQRQGKPVVIAAVMIVAVIVFLKSGMTQRFSAKAIRVNYVTAGRQAMETSIGVSGVINPVISAEIKFPVGGTVKKLLVKEGDSVTKDQVLCYIENSEAQKELLSKWVELKNLKMEMNRAEENLTIGKSLDLQNAQESLQTKKVLYEQKAIAKIDLVIAERDFEKAKVAVSQAERALEKTKTAYANARLQMQDLIEKYGLQTPEQLDAVISGEGAESQFQFAVKSTIAGIVTQLNLKEQDKLFGDNKICLVVDLSQWMVTVDVDEIDIAQVTKGQKVEVRGEAFAPAVLAAHVDSISTTAIKKGAVTAVEVKCLVDDTKGVMLRPGTAARAKIITSSRQGILAVPLESVIKSNSGNVVYVLEGAFAVKRMVETGKNDSRNIEIIRGLQQGESVVTVGALDLAGKEKARVEVER